VEQFINTTIHTVFEEFKALAAHTGGLCACKGLTYEAGQSPDYANPLVQQNYMLHFFPAYLAEYYFMYKAMLLRNVLPERLNVLSIGCGCGADLWGLYYAIEAAGGTPHDRIDYTGVDLVDWQYRDTFGLQNVRFLQQNITEWEELNRSDYNVFVFPKCIGEFSDTVFGSICQMFAKSRFDRQHVCGLRSLMDVGKETDAARFRRIAQIMQAVHRFNCLDELNTYRRPQNPHEGLRSSSICPSFLYPNDIKPKVKALLSACPTHEANGAPCEDECRKLNRSPILYATYVNYQLLRFQRP
jgi:hypothetical protein